MLDQITGSFNTAKAETAAVRAWLKKMGVADKLILSVKKYDGDRNKADVSARIIYGGDVLELTFEVKYEAPRRWKRYHEYGFECGSWSLDGRYVKPAKSIYSEADIWLFYSMENGKYIMLNGYYFDNQKFLEYQNTGTYKESRSKNYVTGKVDTWGSSVSFVKPEVMKNDLITCLYF